MNKLYLDIQTAYANGIKKIEFLESVLTFETSNKLAGILLLKNLQIFPVNDTLKFTGDLIDVQFTDKEIKKIKQKNNKALLKNILMEKLEKQFYEKNKNIIEDKLAEKLIKDIEAIDNEKDDDPFENDITPQQAPKKIKTIYNTIKRMFKDIRIIKFDNNKYTITSDMNSICLNHSQIKLLYSLVEIYGVEFKILAKYDYEDEDDETCYGVKFLWNCTEK